MRFSVVNQAKMKTSLFIVILVLALMTNGAAGKKKKTKEQSVEKDRFKPKSMKEVTHYTTMSKVAKEPGASKSSKGQRIRFKVPSPTNTPTEAKSITPTTKSQTPNPTTARPITEQPTTKQPTTNVL